MNSPLINNSIEITSWDDDGGDSLVGSKTQSYQGNLSIAENKLKFMSQKAYSTYNSGQYSAALKICEQIYEIDAFRIENLLLLGAICFQLRNFSESIFYNQQCIRVDPSFAESYSNLGNSLKELGDYQSAIEFYNKAIKLKPRFSDAYNNLASVYMQIGETDQAMETYNMALILNPGLVDAHNNLGNLFKSKSDLDSAKKCYLEAIRIKPDFAIAWNNLAGVFKDEGQINTAVSYYREATRLCPEFADAHSNLGNALKELNLLNDAIICYNTAIKLRPDFAIAHGNLATCLYDTGEIQQSIRTFKYALQLEPNYPDAHNGLGNAQRDLGLLDDAIQSFRSALRLKPDHPHSYNNLGNAMKDKGFIKEAVHCYVTAVRIMPKFAAAHCNLGSVLKEQGKLEQALAHYHEAITIEPLFVDAYSNLGNVYKDFGKIEEAKKCYSTALKINPSHPEAHCNLASVLKDSGELLASVSSYYKAIELKPDYADAFSNLIYSLIFIANWKDYEENMIRLTQLLESQLLSNETMVPSIQPFHSLAYPFSLQELKMIAERYALKTVLGTCLTDLKFSFRLKNKISKIKVGYVSSNFGNHPISHSIQSLFTLHDKSHFEVTCYSLNSSDKSKWRSKIETESHHFKDISQLHSSEAAQLIHNDGIHVLVNLNGYTKGAKNEIFAYHPAFLQVSLGAFAGTMGAHFMDYLVSDVNSIPTEYRSYYSEKLICLPHTQMINDHKRSYQHAIDGSVILPDRERYGISEDAFVFCYFGQLYKIDPQLFDTWMNILKRVPNSILWLLRFPPEGEENIRNEARVRGVREDQLHFTEVVSNEEHVLRGSLADLYLDTYMCNSHTTAYDILWSGTPMLTISGEKMVSRVGSSILNSAGLSDLVCEDLQSYEELAVALTEDSEKLFSYRRHLETYRESCAAFDTDRWVKNWETGLKNAIKLLEAGQPPDDIYVTDDLPIF